MPAMLRLVSVLLMLSLAALAQDRVVQLLKELTDAPGPPGYEEPVRKIMTEHMKSYADHISYDGLGSVIAQQGNTGPRIMVDAHMDELGGVILASGPTGFFRWRCWATGWTRRFPTSAGSSWDRKGRFPP